MNRIASFVCLIGLAGCTTAVDVDDTGAGAPTAPAALPDDVPPEGAPTIEAYLGGPFAALPAFAGVAVGGQAQLVRRLDGTATLSLSATGLAAGVAHTAHVHTWPCSVEAGGHYLIDPTIADGGEPNEIWSTLTPDPDGNAWTEQTIAAGARGDALSVVIHDPETGDKLACADLTPEMTVGGTASGTFAPFAAAEAGDQTLGGTVTAVIGNTSRVDLALTGLVPTETYASHVHVLPCAVADAGGHYELDPSAEEVIPENEVWPELVPGADGAASASVTVSGHQLREDAQAVVIHRIAGDAAPKVACADLEREGYLPRTTYGAFQPVAGAPAGVTGSAELERRLDGVTVLSVDLAGLTPGARAPVHLHALPCDVLDGGGHYLFDPAQPDVGETNELWAEVVGSAQGTAARAVGRPHLARADAQSVVVHGADGARLGCADLR